MSLEHFFTNLRHRKFLSGTVILFTLALGVVIGTVITGAVGAARDQVAPGATPLSIPAPAQLSSAFVQVAKMVEPAVVNINVESTVKHPAVKRGTPRGGQSPRGGGQEGFEDFFDRFFGGQNAGPNEDMRQRSLGSGIVVDPKGYILTNRHVVNGEGNKAADRIRVKVKGDPNQYEAKVIGTDEETDMAVIKIEPRKTLVAAKMGNSEGMNVGDWVLAIGSPFGLEATVTAGIISAKGRDVPGSSSFQHFVQTDAAINPGNSGGPLVNMAGEVIGVNTAIITSRGSYEGVGFALPSSMAVNVYKTGRVSRGSIGIEFAREDNPAALKVYGGNREGVLVTNVLPGTPAEKAGLKAEDVILTVDGAATRSGNELVAKISETPVGNKVKVHLLRDGKEMDINVAVGERADVLELNSKAEEPDSEAKGGQNVKFGISIQNMTPDMASRLGARDVEGVVVVELDASGFADDIGMQRGDVIQSINKQPVKTVDDVRRIQGTLKSGDAVAFRIQRRSQRTNGLQSSILAGNLP